jgi:hypothetical protein
MANTHQHIDLTTLKEVERLLTTAELTTTDTSSASSSSRVMETVPEHVGGMGPLPKRR